MIHVIVPAIVDQEVTDAAVDGIRRNFCAVSDPSSYRILVNVDAHTRSRYMGTQQTVAGAWRSLPNTTVNIAGSRMGLGESFRFLMKSSIDLAREEDEILLIEDDTILQNPIPASALIGITQTGKRQARLSYAVQRTDTTWWSAESPFLDGARDSESDLHGSFDLWLAGKRFCSTGGMIISRSTAVDALAQYDNFANFGPPEDRLPKTYRWPSSAAVLFVKGANCVARQPGLVSVGRDQHFLIDSIRCKRDDTVNYRR